MPTKIADSRTHSSHPDFNCRFWSLTRSAFERTHVGSRTYDLVEAHHRRFGITPTPELVLPAS